MQGNVTKIYELRTLGYSEITKELTGINKMFKDIKKSKQEAEKSLSESSSVDAQRKLKEEISQIKINLAQTTAELKRKTAEAKAALDLEKLSFQQQKLKQQQEDYAAKQKFKSLEYEKGSYKDIIAQQKELRALLQTISKESGTKVNFNGKSLNYDEATRQLQALSKAEQDFRRQFTQDKLLVGEYTSGIIQSFKEMGLDNIIAGQMTKAGEHLKSLDARAEELRSQLVSAGNAGDAAFDKLQEELIENRKEAAQLQASISSVEKEMSSMGSVGNKINESINSGFKSLKGSLSSLMLQYIGFQALFSKLQSEFSQGIIDAKKIEGVENAFRSLNRPDLLDNLRKATKGTVDDLTLMQNAVKAQNFKIPIENLAGYFEFARRRAKETGESVDYLVNSIITGIGRKSPLILDNLGISAVALKEKLKGVAEENATIGDVATAVGMIISEENQKAAKDIDTHSEKLAKNEARWKNIRTELAHGLLPVLTVVGSTLLGIITTVMGIPFGWWIAGLTAVTALLVSQNKQWILNKIQIIQTTLAQNAHITSTNLLSAAKLILSNNLKVVTAGFKMLWATLRANPITAIVLIIAGLVLWLGKIISQNESVKKSFAGLKTIIEKLTDAFAPLLSVITQLITRVVNALSPGLITLINNVLIPLANHVLPPLVIGIKLVSGAVSVLVGELTAAINVGYKFASAMVKIIEGVTSFNLKKVTQGMLEALQAPASIVGKNMQNRIAKNWNTGFNGSGSAIGSGVGAGSINTIPEISNTGAVIGGGASGSLAKTAAKTQKDIEQARIKEIEAGRDEALAVKEKEFLDGKILEEDYLRETLTINSNALNDKLALIKGHGSEEKAERARINLEIVKNEQETNQKLYDIAIKSLDNKLTEETSKIESNLEEQLQKESLTETEKAQLKINANNKIIELQELHYQEVESLTTKYDQKTKDNLAKLSADILNQKKKNFENERELREAFFRDVDNELSRQKAILSRSVSNEIIEILSDESTTEKQKSKAINKVESINRIKEYDLEIQALKDKFNKEEELRKQGYSNEKNYQEALAALQEKQAERAKMLYESNRTYLDKISDSFKDGWNNLKSIFSGKNEATREEIDSAYEEGVNRVKEAITAAKNLYFESKTKEVEAEKEATLKKIESQKELELRYAQTEEQKAEINEKYEKKRVETEQKAGKEKKRIAIQQATLDFALASIKTLAAYPFPFSLIPMAGLLAQYLVQRATINNTKFEKGGEVPKRGGKFGGKPHEKGGTSFIFKGNAFEAEVDELAIIRTKNAPVNRKYKIEGTQEEIASALNKIGGGIDFKPGAVHLSGKRFAEGGVLGSNYPAPSYKPSSAYSNTKVDSSGVLKYIEKQNETIMGLSNAIIAVSNQVNTLEVVQVTKSVTDAQKKHVKQTQISTL